MSLSSLNKILNKSWVYVLRVCSLLKRLWYENSKTRTFKLKTSNFKLVSFLESNHTHFSLIYHENINLRKWYYSKCVFIILNSINILEKYIILNFRDIWKFHLKEELILFLFRQKLTYLPNNCTWCNLLIKSIKNTHREKSPSI